MVFKTVFPHHKHSWFMSFSNGISVLIWLSFTLLSSEGLNSSGSLSPVVNPQVQRKVWLQRIGDFSSSLFLLYWNSRWLMNDKLMSRPNPGELPPAASLYIPQTDVVLGGNLPWNWELVCEEFLTWHCSDWACTIDPSSHACKWHSQFLSGRESGWAMRTWSSYISLT